MRARLLLSACLLFTPVAASAQTPPATVDDPYMWLEDKDGARSIAWVEAENAKTLPRLQNDPRYKGFYEEALKIVSTNDRLPLLMDQSGGKILNFWSDIAHPHGILRTTTEADFATADPHWTTLLDFDALGKTEGKNWVWHGADCLQPEERYCLVYFSEGGEDAITVREFDLTTAAFVPGGFELPKSKQKVAWIDKDHILASRDWGPGTTTASGYGFVLKSLTRGQPLDAATEVYRGTKDDMWVSPSTVVDTAGHRVTIISRNYFESDKLLLTANGPVLLPMPRRSTPDELIEGRLLIRTSEDWTPKPGTTIPSGALVSVTLADLNDGGTLSPTILFQPGPRQSIVGFRRTKGHVLLAYTDNIRGRVAVYTPTAAGWTSRQVALPDNVSITLVSSTDRSDQAYLSATGFLTPTSLWSVDATAGTARQVKATPALFDASNEMVEQFEATSSDGTKIPYFIVHRKDIPLDGTTPTYMFAYGGFEVSPLPNYAAGDGKLWFERGGSYVLANIRGGGEFGPKWHEAGLKTHRQLIFDDFTAVAKDLFARHLTSPARLGIFSGSNGGLLLGVEMEQHPELWKAVAMQAPLLDMMRYEQIQTGAAWTDEYGSVSNLEERAFLASISPYQNLKKGVAYPEPFIWTSTKDDRVGPQHARKFVARMAEYGLPYLYYEYTAGGHFADADLEQRAQVAALLMVYFTQKLMDDPAKPAGGK